MYGVYHGPQGLKKIAGRVHGLTKSLASGIEALGNKQVNENYFDTLKVQVSNKDAVQKEALKREVNFRYFNDNHIGISLDETSTVKEVQTILEIFAAANGKPAPAFKAVTTISWPAELVRTSSFMTHPVFSSYHP
jgi:glycine dehydrogenase